MVLPENLKDFGRGPEGAKIPVRVSFNRQDNLDQGGSRFDVNFLELLALARSNDDYRRSSAWLQVTYCVD